MPLFSTALRTAAVLARVPAAAPRRLRMVHRASEDGMSAAESSIRQQHASSGGTPAAGVAPAAAAEPTFRIVDERVVHKRYLTLYNRAVQFPAVDGQGEGPVHEYDVAGHPQCDFHFTVVFPFHPEDNSVTLIREYAQGLNELVWCLPTGGYDPRKHSNYEACARAELSEEAHLAGGTWLPLIPEEHPGIAEVKWCRNRFHSYLCIDPQPDAAPGRRDQEEFIQVCRLSLPELRQLMLSGDMLLPSVATCFIALERIQQWQQQQQDQQRWDGRH